MSDPLPEYLTVPELAELLRLKERKIYDLAASGDLPVSRATGKLLFPRSDVQAWVDAKKTAPDTQKSAPNVLLGSHDPLLEWAIRQSQCGLATLLDSSADGLARFQAGEGIAAGLHIFDPKGGAWNTRAVETVCGSSNAVLVKWARRKRGFITRTQAPFDVASLSDLKGKKVAARQSTSGAHILLTHLLEQDGINPDLLDLSFSALSEQDAVLSVAEGSADVAFGLETLARPYGLRFQGVAEEQFDLLLDRRAYFQPSLQTLLTFCRSDEFRARATSMGGYDVSELGEVCWNP